MRWYKYSSIFFITITLAGCMVGPNFHTPAAPKVTGYTETPLPKKTASSSKLGNGGVAQQFEPGHDISAEWWHLFHSPEINDLIERGLANSPTVPAAEAALRQAQENVKVEIGNALFPALNLNLGGQRQLYPGSSVGGTIPSTLFNLYTANVSVTYNLDIFGGARRNVESLIAQADYQKFQLIAAYLTLTSNIVSTAITVASLEAQIDATKKLINAEENLLIIIRKQFQLGGVAESNVFSQETLVEQAVATLPELQKSLSQSLHSLSVLVGEFPNQPLPKINLNALVLPAQLPVSLPSHLVRQRPDVRASEELFHSASAQVGVATANLFPQFNLAGNYGWSGSVPSTLFQTINKTWSYGGTIMQPIFHGGALRAQRRAAIAAFDQAAAQYRQTLLQAFQNVADSLRALETDARALRAQRAAEIAARKSLVITQQQYRLGGVDYLNVLTAQQQYQQTVINRIRAQAMRYADTVALFQALGGGWWNSSLICTDKFRYEKS